ncbi:murein hydrolase activator EnvC family protein [Allofustis seminis]|uniref:murein hydrolase activator EnvC family protein n=1 Tax=Allofustis seminis TaxID=166939 RepID=UPI00037BD270|nr:M23 family metallopeptidase [Allofustis seminis]
MNKKIIKNILVSTSILLLMLGQNSLLALADISDLQNRQEEIQQESDHVSEKINETETEIGTLESKKSVLEAEVEKLQKQIDEIVQKIVAHQQKITELDEEVQVLEKEIEILEEKIEKRSDLIKIQARSVQVTGSPQSVVDILLEATSVTDLLGRMELVSTIVGTNFDIMEDQRNDQEAVKKSVAKIEKNRHKQEELKQQLDIEKNNILAQQVEFDYKVEKIADQLHLSEEKKREFIAQNVALAAESSNLSGEIREIRNQIVADQEAAKQSQLAAAREAQINEAEHVSTSTSSSSSSSQSSPTTSSGGWIRPSNGYVSNPYGPDPFYSSGFHGGIDLAGSGPIVASKAGVVTTAGYLGDYGYCVIIDHGGGESSLYGHLQPGLSVYPGQSVSQGQKLGIMGSTGLSTGVHLHFEIRINGQRVNPANYLSF